MGFWNRRKKRQQLLEMTIKKIENNTISNTDLEKYWTHELYSNNSAVAAYALAEIHSDRHLNIIMKGIKERIEKLENYRGGVKWYHKEIEKEKGDG